MLACTSKAVYVYATATAAATAATTKQFNKV